MRELPQGNGIWIWRARNSAGGDPERIAAECLRQGFGHVLLKAADGTRRFKSNAGLDARIAARLRSAGVQPIAWGYHYGVAPEAEARTALQACADLECSIYVLNAEKEFERPGGAGAIRQFISAFLADGGDDLALGLSTYALPESHPGFPYSTALEGEHACDFVMPQIYTVPSRRRNYLTCLETYFAESRRQLAKFGKPIMPTLRAYAGDGMTDWNAIKDDAAAFHRATPGLGLTAWNWWVWEQAERRPELWAAVGGTEKDE